MSLSSRKTRGAPRWVVTFADLMSLLFALFVLLLSFSEIDSDSFRKNASSISEAFNITTIIKSDPTTRPDSQIIEELRQQTEEIEQKKYRFMSRLEREMSVEITNAMVEVLEKEHEIVIRFPDKSAFPSGSMELVDAALPMLDKVARVLVETEGQIQVAGHTDNQPISTSRIRSNWDLSAARAVSVVHYLLQAAAIDISRVTAQGFADSRPLAPNDTPENRAKNRRVEISIEMTED